MEEDKMSRTSRKRASEDDKVAEVKSGGDSGNSSGSVIDVGWQRAFILAQIDNE